ncbi:hypothetical protein OH828_37000 [Streptomyces anulatus]|uniref:hypothetical protein n=3 Tax=Streptomyces TaxID=1883 RepID=UPI000BEF1D6C|nr:MULTISPECIES: hypothetical protein [Streptomyces]UPT39972.1 hypothetical protein MWG59_00200 [Streptomyces sp. WAC00303]WIY74264.1 hypothetical protein QPM16_00190 [Streptomyces anulatus]WTF66361.1 hypothetical protein OH791_37325 [Streptomyces anulatus]
MTYRLHFPGDVFDTYKQLPELARRDLALALVDAQEDPLANSEPYGQDDGIIRTVARGHITAVLLLGHDTRTITVLTIAYAGTT